MVGWTTAFWHEPLAVTRGACQGPPRCPRVRRPMRVNRAGQAPNILPDLDERSGVQRYVVKLDPDDLSDESQIHVPTQQGSIATPCNRDDHAVDHPPRGGARLSTPSIDPGRGIEVHDGIEWQPREPQ